MTRGNWLYAWGLGSVAAGGASLLVPLYVVALGGGPATLGLLAAVAAGGGALGAYVAGALADRTGRWRLLGAGSLAGIVVALVGVALVSAVPAIVLANGLLWVSFSAATPVFTMLAVRDASAAERSRRIARLNRVQGYGWAAGLGLGAVWTVAVDAAFSLSPLASQRAFLWLCVAVGSVGALAAAWWLPATDHGTAVEGRRRLPFRRPVVTTLFPFLPARLYERLQRLTPRQFVDRFTPALATYFLAATLFFAGFGMFFAPLPAYLSALGYTSAHVFGLFLVSALGSAAAYGSAGRLVGRYDTPSLQATALGLRGLALPAVAVAHGWGLGLGAAALLFAVIGASWAVVATAAVDHITELTPPAIRGESLGVYTAVSALAGGVGSLAGGTLAEAAGYAPTFAAACVVVLVSAVVVLRPERLGLAG